MTTTNQQRPWPGGDGPSAGPGVGGADPRFAEGLAHGLPQEAAELAAGRGRHCHAPERLRVNRVAVADGGLPTLGAA